MASRRIPNHLAHYWNTASCEVEQSHHSRSGIPVQWMFRMGFENLFCSRAPWTSNQQAKAAALASIANAWWLMWDFLRIGQGPCLRPTWKTLPPTTVCSLKRLHTVNSQLLHHWESPKPLPASNEGVEQFLAPQLLLWVMASLVISICSHNNFAIP